MTRGIWGDPERYLDTYWRRFPGVWTHGDWASIDADGDWFLHGRSDDTLNVAGKRIGPGRVRVGAGRRSGRGRGLRRRRAARGQGRGRLVLLRAASRAASPARSCARACATRCARGARQGVRARRGALHDGAAEDAQRQDPAPRRARDGARRGSRRPLDARGSRARSRPCARAPELVLARPGRGRVGGRERLLGGLVHRVVLGRVRLVRREQRLELGGARWRRARRLRWEDARPRGQGSARSGARQIQCFLRAARSERDCER